MKRSLISLAVHFACLQIGAEWRVRHTQMLMLKGGAK